MKICRMWRVETRKLLYPKENSKMLFRDPLNPKAESATFAPQHGPIGVGPYTLLKTKHGEVAKGHPQWRYAEWLMAINEPSADSYYSKFNYGQKAWTEGRIPPALWKSPTPGPIEDPYLRDYWLALTHEQRVQSVFGFAEAQDFCKWFHTPGLVEWLAQNGFGLAEYRSRMIKHGLRQSTMRVDEPYELMQFLPLQLKVEIGGKKRRR